MISGIPTAGGQPSPSFVTKFKTANAQPAQATVPEVQAESRPAESQAPDGDEQTLAREYNLFDLATRQFAQILPRLELATVPLE